MTLINSLFFLLIALTAFSVVILRPDRWAGANETSTAVKHVILSFLHRNVAHHKDVARFRYLNLICMSLSAFALAILLVSTVLIPATFYVTISINLAYIWFFITVLSHLVVSAVTPKP